VIDLLFVAAEFPFNILYFLNWEDGELILREYGLGEGVPSVGLSPPFQDVPCFVDLLTKFAQLWQTERALQCLQIDSFCLVEVGFVAAREDVADFGSK
jgi:hypothetical protein